MFSVFHQKGFYWDGLLRNQLQLGRFIAQPVATLRSHRAPLQRLSCCCSSKSKTFLDSFKKVSFGGNPFYATIASEPRNGSSLYWKHGAGTVCPNGALIPVGDGAPYGHQPVGAAYGPVGATPLRTSRSLPRAPVFLTLLWGEGPGFIFVFKACVFW